MAWNRIWRTQVTHEASWTGVPDSRVSRTICLSLLLQIQRSCRIGNDSSLLVQAQTVLDSHTQFQRYLLLSQTDLVKHCNTPLFTKTWLLLLNAITTSHHVWGLFTARIW